MILTKTSKLLLAELSHYQNRLQISQALSLFKKLCFIQGIIVKAALGEALQYIQQRLHPYSNLQFSLHDFFLFMHLKYHTLYLIIQTDLSRDRGLSRRGRNTRASCSQRDIYFWGVSVGQFAGTEIISMNIFLFHRDLRLTDNTGLIKQIKQFKQVTPIFIFPPAQIDPARNQYFSHNSVQFMVESLQELGQDIKAHGGTFYYFKGDNLDVLKSIHAKFKIGSLGYNLDYTPFAKTRDKQISDWADSEDVQLITEQDYGLYPMLNGQLVNQKSEKPYQVFTPFRNYCLKSLTVSNPDPFDKFKFKVQDGLTKLSNSFAQSQLTTLFEHNSQLAVQPGRKAALTILSEIKKFKNYNKSRNNPSLPTTQLSAHLHFTTVSAREVYHAIRGALGADNNLVNELHWRQFYMCVTNYFPKVLQGKSFKQKFDEIKWKYEQKHLEAWKTGHTGFPIVDAAMRQLNVSGWMHNRSRMIVSSFLAKDLFLDWHEGEKYFATKLVDYSPMQNSGGWQWAAGNGTDAAPYFRIFNPWTQQKTYDEDCRYIQKWIPQLKQVPVEDIHGWAKSHTTYRKKGVQYPAPIINHDEARKETLDTYNLYLKKQ